MDRGGENTLETTGPAPSTRILRALVPSALAAGIVALYPAISETVVAKLGRGFEPKLVAVYVATLMALFLADAWVRDRRLARLRRLAIEAERRAEGQRERADALRFVLEVSQALSSTDRLETGLLAALERLREALPFEVGCFFLRDAGGGLARRGICPLIAKPVDSMLAQARAALEPGAPDVIAFDGGRTVACRVADGANGTDAIGAIVLALGETGADDPEGEACRAPLLAVADRLGADLRRLRLVDDLEGKERALRNAYQELRQSGRKLARSTALEEATVLGQAASRALARPLSSALEEVRRLLRRPHADASDQAALRRALGELLEMRDRLKELRDLGKAGGRRSTVQVNDALVAAIDLQVPDLKRAGIEVRMSFDRSLPPIEIDEAVLSHLFARVLRRSRAAFRRASHPRRLAIATLAFGDGVRITFQTNTAGVGEPVLPAASRASGEAPAQNLRQALRASGRALSGIDWKSHGISLKASDQLGEGRTLTVSLAATQLSGSPGLL